MNCFPLRKGLDFPVNAAIHAPFTAGKLEGGISFLTCVPCVLVFLFRQSTYGNAVIFCSSACSLCSFPVLLACSLHIQRLCGNLQVWKWSDGWDRRDSMLHFVSDSSWWTYRALWLSILSVAEVKSFPPYMHQLHSLSTYVCMMMSGWREMWLHVTVESSQEIASWHLRKQNIPLSPQWTEDSSAWDFSAWDSSVCR